MAPPPFRGGSCLFITLLLAVSIRVVCFCVRALARLSQVRGAKLAIWSATSSLQLAPFPRTKTQEQVRTFVQGYTFPTQSCLTSRQSEISSMLPVDPVTRHAATSGMTATAAFSAMLWIELAARRFGPATGRASYQTRSPRSPIQPSRPLTVRVPGPHQGRLLATGFCVFWSRRVLKRNRHVLTCYINRVGRRRRPRCCCRPRHVLRLALSACYKGTKTVYKMRETATWICASYLIR